MANTKNNYNTHGERRGVFEIREVRKHCTCESSYIYFLHRYHIYIYTLFVYFKKIKKDTHNLKKYAQDPNRITKNKYRKQYLVPPPYYIEINIKKIHMCFSKLFSSSRFSFREWWMICFLWIIMFTT